MNIENLTLKEIRELQQLFNFTDTKEKKTIGNYPLTTSKSQGLIELNSYKDSI